MSIDLSAAGCPLVELRQYTLHPGRRDALIDLFDREFVETQEAVGMTVMGQFRDLDDADRFVWLRGFRDMAARQAGLSAFYGGPVWQAMFDGLAAFDAFVRSGVWAREARPQLAPWLARPTESHRLVPTARSALHA